MFKTAGPPTGILTTALLDGGTEDFVVVAVVDVVRDAEDTEAAAADDVDNRPRLVPLALETVLVAVDDRLLLLVAFAASN